MHWFKFIHVTQVHISNEHLKHPDPRNEATNANKHSKAASSDSFYLRSWGRELAVDGDPHFGEHVCRDTQSTQRDIGMKSV